MSVPIHVLVGTLDEVLAEPAQVPFSEESVDFLAGLSSRIFSTSTNTRSPDLVALGYWLRRANLQLMRRSIDNIDGHLVGRGVSIHFAPKNVPLNAAYTMALGLLSGNRCVIRISPSSLEDLQEFLDVLRAVIEDDESGVSKRICFLSYEINDEATRELSELADVRLIWGGDETVRYIRTIPSKPRCIDIPFTDRISIALLDSDSVSQCSPEELATLCERFLADYSVFGQNACSSPRLVAWHGENVDARSRFWAKLDAVTETSISNRAAATADRLVEFCLEMTQVTEPPRTLEYSSSSFRIRVEPGQSWLSHAHLRFGTFSETVIHDLRQLSLLVSPRVQTVTHFGFGSSRDLLHLLVPTEMHFDHLVPVGQALQFHLKWDGFDLIRLMTRTVSVI